MESENLFKKLNKQSESIDLIAEKLDGVSISDLYALAKRTWNYRDYEMAQKYYNHISLLNPLEWEAPFRASLCGCLGIEVLDLWERRPETIIEYYQSTVEYIHSCDSSQSEKIASFLQATEIILEVLKEYIRIYLIPNNRDSFDKYAPIFKSNLQKAFVSILIIMEKYAYQEMEQMKDDICKELTGFIAMHCQSDKSICISRDDFNKYVLPYNTQVVYNENVFVEQNLDPEQEKEIKLKGKCYLVYKDSILEDRYRKKNIVFGVLLLIVAFAGLLLHYGKNFVPALINSFLVFFVAGIMLFRGLGRKKGILQNSWINLNRLDYRLTSNVNVIHEKKFSPMLFFACLVLVGFGFYSIFASLMWCWEGYKLYESIFLIVCNIIEWMGAIIFYSLRETAYGCNKKIEYNGKTYLFE